MDVFIARQPIFDRDKRLYAYDLLFRESMGGTFANVDGNRATTSLLSATFLTEGLEKVSGGKPCFIHFSEELLTKDIAAFFSKTKIVVEVLGDVEPTRKVIEACAKLSELGYLIALDDFVYKKKLDPLIRLADIVKLDFRLSTMDKIEWVMHKLSHYDLEFLAGKVETYDEFDQAVRFGFTYYQGYFFSQPETLRIKEVASVKLNLLNLLAEVNRRKTTVDRLDKIISIDVGITYKLLRYINSAYFYLLQEVTSVRQAIVYLGAAEICRFVTLVIISELASDKPEELIKLSVIRGRFCELIARAGNGPVEASELFLLGLFSLLDALLDTPMVEIVKKLPLADAVKEALVEKSGTLFPYLQVVTAYERGDRERCVDILHDLHIPPDDVFQLYLNAIQFSEFLSKS